VSAVDALLDQLPRTTLVVGKGGVGKTTCAAALALRASSRIGNTLVITTDPARALPTVLEQPVMSEPTPVRGMKRLSAQVLDAEAQRSRFMDRWGDTIRMILDRGTYLDKSDIDPLVDTAMPGGDEIFSALALAELLNGGRNRSYRRILVDTAPTGHTLRLLNLPRAFRALVQLLDAMQAKHRFMVRTLTRAYRTDEADAFLREMNDLVTALEESLQDPNRCAAVMVTNTQPLVLEETRRYLDALTELHIHVAAIIWNATDGGVPALGDAHQYTVPKLDRGPTGKAGLERWLAALRVADSNGAKKKPTRFARTARKPKPTTEEQQRSTPDEAAVPNMLRPLTIAAGKGGVGKTTVASALALHAAKTRRTLVVSTDPAPSLADALAQSIPDADTPVRDVPNLFARQMDASAAFERLRADYQSRVDALFDGLVAKSVDLTADRAIARDLLSLAPPGVDEVYALSLLSDALFKDSYECVVVDPAPTGHLLRLLEMPKLALAWTHQLLRLMLKYKDVVGLGETAQELLDFSRNLRALDALLRDKSRCAIVLVTLDEPVVRAETDRLASEVRSRGVDISGVILNRAPTDAGGAEIAEATALPVADAPVHFEAPAVEPSPVGPRALREWSTAWRIQRPHEEESRKGRKKSR
jgi:arsenite/tail-anchored protein-transporting ATPase